MRRKGEREERNDGRREGTVVDMGRELVKGEGEGGRNNCRKRERNGEGETGRAK